MSQQQYAFFRVIQGHLERASRAIELSDDVTVMLSQPKTELIVHDFEPLARHQRERGETPERAAQGSDPLWDVCAAGCCPNPRGPKPALAGRD